MSNLRPSIGRSSVLTNSSKQAQRHRQKHQRMQRRPQHERKPHSKIVDLEDLASRERQHKDAEKFGDSDATEDASANVHERGPCSCFLPAEPWTSALEDRGRRDGEGTSDVCAEFNTDADADDDVNEGDGVEGDVGQGHGASDVNDDHADGHGDDEACCDGAEEEAGDEENEG